MNNMSLLLKKAVIPILSALFVAAAGMHPCEGGSPIRETEENHKPVIAVLGSSLAAGWVTSRKARFDMQNGWAFRLERLLSERGFKTVNLSQPGDTTEKALGRLDKDLFPLEPDFVVISLSLENEGIRGIQGKIPDRVYKEFQANLQSIIDRCRGHKIVPILASCYPSDNYIEDRHYQYIKNMNLELAAWDVPGINLLGALDDGSGRFVEGITFDLDHPDSRGHAELFYSVVPGLFKALSVGIPLPSKAAGSGCFSLKKSLHPAPLSFIPEDPIHSFSLAFEVRPESSGTLACIQSEAGDFSRLHWDVENNALIYETTSGKRSPLSTQPLKGESWHHITMSHRYLKGETLIYVNGRRAASVEETILPVHMVLGGQGSRVAAPDPLTADFKNWMIYRSALNDVEAASLAEGNLLQPSLELFISLDDELGDTTHPLKNYAQSTSRADAFPQSWADQVSDLKEKIAALDRSETTFVDPNAKKPVPIDPDGFSQLTGDYIVDDNLVLTVVVEKSRLFLLFNGGDMGKQELFPLSTSSFFIRIVGPEAEAQFIRGEEGAVEEIKLTIGPTTIVGKKTVTDTALPSRRW